MSSEDKLVSITLEDLDSLIDCYERPGNSHTTLDSLFALRNYQRWLKDPQSPKVIYLDILTVNNHWDRDGLFLLVVSKQINILSGKLVLHTLCVTIKISWDFE